MQFHLGLVLLGLLTCVNSVRFGLFLKKIWDRFGSVQFICLGLDQKVGSVRSDRMALV